MTRPSTTDNGSIFNLVGAYVDKVISADLYGHPSLFVAVDPRRIAVVVRKAIGLPLLTAVKVCVEESKVGWAIDLERTALIAVPDTPETVVELIDGEVSRVNKKFANVEQVKKFSLIDIQLTAEDDELTPTMKLKRKFINDKYSNIIESMYQSAWFSALII